MASIQSVVDLLTKYINLLHGKNIHTEGDQDIAGIKNFTGTLQSGGYAVDSIYQTGDRYIRYNNGIQIAWGAVLCRNKLYNNSLQTVTFPAFKDTAYIWTFGILNIASDVIAGGEAVSNTSMHIAIRNAAGSEADFSTWVYYHLFGYWK